MTGDGRRKNVNKAAGATKAAGAGDGVPKLHFGRAPAARLAAEGYRGGRQWSFVVRQIKKGQRCWRFQVNCEPAASKPSLKEVLAYEEGKW